MNMYKLIYLMLIIFRIYRHYKNKRTINKDVQTGNEETVLHSYSDLFSNICSKTKSLVVLKLKFYFITVIGSFTFARQNNYIFIIFTDTLYSQ